VIVIAGKNNIAVHGLLLAIKYFCKDEIIVIASKNDCGTDGWQRSLRKFATEQGVAIKSLKDVYKEKKIDHFISLEFDQIIKPELLSTESIYNVHFSDLPKYKGMYTSVWPVLFGDIKSGVTLHKIDSGIDTGDIVAKEVFSLSATDRSQDCYEKYIKNAKALLSSWFERIIDHKIVLIEQVSLRSSYNSVSSIDFNNLKINFNKTAWEIQRQVYAFSFRPYQLLIFNERKVSNVIITKHKSKSTPGTVQVEKNNFSLVSTIDFDVEVHFDQLSHLLSMIPFISVIAFSESLVDILGVNDRNDKGWSPIIVAAYNGRRDLIEFLIEKGADINDRNYKGTTVLMFAKDYSIKNIDKCFFKDLIRLGADPALEDWSGKTVRDYLTIEEKLFLEL
jgi:methionyl-tRNA formyltransferase